MKNIVITGGSGRLGELVIHELVTRGYETLNLDRAAPRQQLGKFRLADLRQSGEKFSCNDARGVLLEQRSVISPGRFRALG